MTLVLPIIMARLLLQKLAQRTVQNLVARKKLAQLIARNLVARKKPAQLIAQNLAVTKQPSATKQVLSAQRRKLSALKRKLSAQRRRPLLQLAPRRHVALLLNKAEPLFFLIQSPVDHSDCGAFSCHK